jgi:hypothetical protein
MRLLYKPFSLFASLLAARIGKTMFKSLWSRIDETDPPSGITQDASLSKVVAASALEAATMAGVAAAADRASARAFEWLTGVWPGKEPEERD